MILIGVGMAVYFIANSDEVLERSIAEIHGEGSSRTALIRLRNISERQVSFRTFRLHYRNQGNEWIVDPPSPVFAELKYPRLVRPGQVVDFPIPLEKANGSPLTGIIEVGISYVSPKRTWIGLLPSGLRNPVGSAFGTPEGKAARSVHWIQMVGR